MCRKPPVSPSLTIKKRSKTMERHEKPSKLSGHEKTPETLIFRGFLHVRWSRSALAELRSTTCRFEAVLNRYRALQPLILLCFERWVIFLSQPLTTSFFSSLPSLSPGLRFSRLFQCVVNYWWKLFELIILCLCVDVHSDLAVLMSRCKWSSGRYTTT